MEEGGALLKRKWQNILGVTVCLFGDFFYRCMLWWVRYL